MKKVGSGKLKHYGLYRVLKPRSPVHSPQHAPALTNGPLDSPTGSLRELHDAGERNVLGVLAVPFCFPKVCLYIMFNFSQLYSTLLNFAYLRLQKFFKRSLAEGVGGSITIFAPDAIQMPAPQPQRVAFTLLPGPPGRDHGRAPRVTRGWKPYVETCKDYISLYFI